MAERHVVSVRTLAEYACAHGSLKAGAFLQSRMREGSAGHKRIQEKRPDGWEAEVNLAYDCTVDGVAMRVQGRADLAKTEEDRVCIGEIKTTRVDPNLILKDDYPEHWAQAEIYAYMLCLKENKDEAHIELIYASGEKEHRFLRDFSTRELGERFNDYAAPYAQYLKAGEAWAETAAPTLADVRFPFDTFREGQIEMSDAVYEAMHSGSTIIEAPTGIGKTIASLYGAVRALSEGAITRIFYLTARTTGRRAAETALDRMRASGLKLRSVTVTAREKACFLEREDCAACRYAMGYYDRRRDAVMEAMACEVLNEETIAELARAHEICPFELSLDLTMIADAVICDYNYVFDPRIRLKRHFEKKSRAGILVDEAHNLIDRSREMYSASLSHRNVKERREKIRETFREGSAVDQAITALIEALQIEEAEYDARRDVPGNIVQAAQTLYDITEQLRVSDDETRELMFECGWFLRIVRMFDDACYRAMIIPEGKDNGITIKLWCFAPQGKLEKLYAHVGGAALFSATLAPIGYYAKALGVPDPARQMTLESPFPTENLLTAMLPVSVRYKDRNDTLEKVTRVIQCMTESHKGNYLACFPSHAYLTQAYRYYRMRYPDADVICQKPYMNEQDRARFIESFQTGRNGSLTAFIVMGGVFSEGVDLPGELLSGTVIVSTGLPLPNPESELLVTMSEDDREEGMDAAYTFPGFRKVLQAAGRVIRTETDRGVVLLLDDRYFSPKYAELFPQHWRVKRVTGMRQLREMLERFWQE